MKRYDWEIGPGPNYVLGQCNLGADKEVLIKVAAQAAERACRKGLHKARFKSTDFEEAAGLRQEYKLWVQVLCDDGRTWKVGAETKDRSAYLVCAGGRLRTRARSRDRLPRRMDRRRTQRGLMRSQLPSGGVSIIAVDFAPRSLPPPFISP